MLHSPSPGVATGHRTRESRSFQIPVGLGPGTHPEISLPVEIPDFTNKRPKRTLKKSRLRAHGRDSEKSPSETCFTLGRGCRRPAELRTPSLRDPSISSRSPDDPLCHFSAQFCLRPNGFPMRTLPEGPGLDRARHSLRQTQHATRASYLADTMPLNAFN